MVVKMGKFRFFPPTGGIPYLDFDYFCKSFCGNGMDLYSRHIMAAISRDAARHVSTQNGNNNINL